VHVLFCFKYICFYYITAWLSDVLRYALELLCFELTLATQRNSSDINAVTTVAHNAGYVWRPWPLAKKLDGCAPSLLRLLIFVGEEGLNHSLTDGV
jgi:hypothetical protein